MAQHMLLHQAVAQDYDDSDAPGDDADVAGILDSMEQPIAGLTGSPVELIDNSVSVADDLVSVAASLPKGYACTRSGKPCFPGRSRAGLPRCPNDYLDASDMYGCSGKDFKAWGRLTDWSYAGYHFGQDKIPNLKAKYSLKKDFGAKGDGKADDSGAFLRAAAKGGVVYIPTGRYRLTKMIKITKRLVLIGAGQGKTVIYIDRTLRDALGGGPGRYSYNPAFFYFQSYENTGSWVKPLARISRDASRGARRFAVSSTKSIKSGTWIRILVDDTWDGRLLRDLHSNLFPAQGAGKGRRSMVRFTSRVTKVGKDWIELERAINFNISTRYFPRVIPYLPALTECGMQSMTIQFKCMKYAGHHKENGANAVYFQSMHHSWLKDMEIQNADIALVSYSSFMSFVNLKISSCNRGNKYSGHYGVQIGFGTDNLIDNVEVNGYYVHDFSVYGLASGNVFSRLKGKDLNFDHHRTCPHNNLWTDIYAGKGTRVWASGGVPTDGPNTGSFSTFWNVRADKQISLLRQKDFGPKANYVGVRTSSKTWAGPAWAVESTDRGVYPQNLYTHQLSRRKKSKLNIPSLSG